MVPRTRPYRPAGSAHRAGERSTALCSYCLDCLGDVCRGVTHARQTRCHSKTPERACVNRGSCCEVVPRGPAQMAELCRGLLYQLPAPRRQVTSTILGGIMLFMHPPLSNYDRNLRLMAVDCQDNHKGQSDHCDAWRKSSIRRRAAWHRNSSLHWPPHCNTAWPWHRGGLPKAVVRLQGPGKAPANTLRTCHGSRTRRRSPL